MSWNFTPQSRLCELVRLIRSQYGTIQRLRRLRLRSNRLHGNYPDFGVGEVSANRSQHNSCADWSFSTRMRPLHASCTIWQLRAPSQHCSI